MFNIGFDFDNTLVNYDAIFYELALKKGLIKSDVKKNKLSVRNYLRANGDDKLFTLLQGEVYGKKITDIKPCFDLLRVLKQLIDEGNNLFIVSHKTKTPFLGPKYDLHKAAKNWLEKNNFFNKNGPNLSIENIYFEETLPKKLERISRLSCNVFIDDLPEVLNQLDENIVRIHYDTNGKFTNNNLITLSEWKNLPKVLKNIIKK